MSRNTKQRVTLTDLKEPQQIRELNRQLTWIWDQLLGGLSMKSLNAGARKVIDSKADSEEVDALGNVVVQNSTSIVQTAEKIESTATRVETLDGRMEEAESRILQTPDEIRLAVEKLELGGRNLLRGTKELDAAAGDLSKWETQSVHSRSEGGDGFYQIGWKAAGLTADSLSRLKSPLFKLPDGWLGRKAALSCWMKAEDWDTLDGGLEARICLTAGERSDDYRWARMRLIDAGGGAGAELSGTGPADGQWRRIWAVAELTQEGLRGSGTIELPEPVREEKPVYEPAGDEEFGIWRQPEDLTVAVGETVVLKIGAAGAVKYQWQNSADGVTWSNSGIAGYDTDTLTFSMIAVRYGYVWRCVITNADGGTLASRAARLIAPSPIVKQPESVDATAGQTVVLTIEATGNVTYQWQNSQNGETWTNSGLTGYSTASLSVPVTEARYNYLWRCRVTDAAGMVHVSGPAVIRKPLNAATHGWAGWYVKRNADFFMKAPQLEFGDRPSDWSPAPEDVDGELSRLESELVVQADEIALRVKQETLDAAIDGVQVGGRNLLLNTGKLSKANYSFNNSSVASVNVGLGSYAEDEYGGFHIVCNNQNVRIEMGTFPVTPGQTYAMSARYKINSGSAPIQFQYIFRNAAGTGLHYWDSVNHSEVGRRVEDGWTVMSSVFTVPDNTAITTMKLAIRTGKDNTAYTCDYNIRRPKLEVGSRATDWTPAPEDGELEVKRLEAELSVQAGKITANATKIETVNQAAAGAQSAANAAQNAANANAGNLTAVTKRVTTAEQSISALDGQVQTKVSQNDFNALGNRVASAESAITVQADKISSKVEKSEFDALGNTVSQMGTEIQQNEEEILLLAGRTVGGTNMLKNTETLRKANYSFNSSGSDAMGSCTEDEHGGFHVVCKDSNLRWQVTELPVTPGQSYVMSVQYKINSGSAPIQFQYVFRDAAGTGLHYWDSVNHSQVGARIEDGWTVMTSVFTVPDNEQVAELRLAVRTGLDYGSYTCDYNIRRPKFEAGSMATAWSPSPDDPAGSVNAGGVVRVDQTGVHMSGGTIEMETSDGDEYIYIRNSGIVASSMEAPNVARRYAGAAALYVNPNATSAQVAAGNYYRSLADACAAVSGRYLEKNVTITVQGATYGDAYLRGVTGYGSVTVGGGNNILYGSLSLLDNTAEIWVNSLKIVRTGTNQVFAGRQYGMGWARWYQCILDGNGGDQALLSDRGARLMIHETELYNAARLLQVSHNADASCVSLKGGGGTHFFHGDGGRVTWSGTRPDGTLSIANPCLREPYDLAALTIDYGTAQPSAPVVQTAAYNYLYSDSYRSGWQWFSDDDIRQGYDGGVIYGVIWFDAAAIRSALNGKTINQVSLRLYMAKGVGRGVNVNVELYGSNVSYDRTTAPALTTSYGSIGETQPDVVNEITIPAQAVKDMISGTINALVLRSSDSEYHKDRPYSRNYAKFAGSTTATAENCPRLTVVYQ